MSKLLMITGDRQLAQGKKGAFWNTISEFHKHWERIDIITPGIEEHRYNMVILNNVHIHPSPFPILFQPLWIWWKGKQLVRQQHHLLATVHSYAPFYNNMGAWLLRLQTGIPLVLEVLHVTGVPRASNIREWIYRLMVLFFFRFWASGARAIRVMNEHETPDFLIRAGVNKAKLLHIPALYIDLEIFRPLDIPKKYDLMYVGRLASNKGLKRFMEIVRSTHRKALIVGEGPLLEWARDFARKHRVSVVFSGFAKDQLEVSDLMNSARLLVMVSDNEGGPRVVVESLACGVPVLATPVGIVPDVLPPEAIEEWDTQALSDKANNILDDEQLYARLREGGLLMSQSFDRKTTVVRYADELKKLIE